MAGCRARHFSCQKWASPHKQKGPVGRPLVVAIRVQLFLPFLPSRAMIDPQEPPPTIPPKPSSPIRAPQEFWGGVGLLAFVAFAFWALRTLSQGTLNAMGPAMVPRALAGGIALCAIILIVSSFVTEGHPLQRFSVRGPVFIVVAILAFAFTIRNFGLLVAGPLAMIIGGCATPETRWKEIIIFAAIMTAFCAGLFRYALKLPIPILNLPGIIQL